MASTLYKILREHVELWLSTRKINDQTISAETAPAAYGSVAFA